MGDEPSFRNRLYWPQLDGLRFFAALLVFVHHSNPLPGVPHFVRIWGWVGVDLFFVLSAYLLTRLLRAEIERSSAANIGHFFIRRICRIWPLYWGFVSAMLLVVYMTMPAASGQALWEWFSHIAFFNNVYLATHGYGTALPHTGHLWTIALEEQYYLLVPLAVPLLVQMHGKARPAAVIGVALLLLLAGRSLCVLLEMPHPFIWALPLRIDGLLLGTALGLGLFDRAWIAERGGACFVAGVALLFAATRLPRVELVGWAQVPAYTVVGAACTLLVIGSLHHKPVAAFLSVPLLRYLGKVSFGIYVWHVVVISGVETLAERSRITDPWLIFAASLFATCVVAAASYELYERHFLKLKRRYTAIESRPV